MNVKVGGREGGREGGRGGGEGRKNVEKVGAEPGRKTHAACVACGRGVWRVWKKTNLSLSVAPTTY